MSLLRLGPANKRLAVGRDHAFSALESSGSPAAHRRPRLQGLRTLAIILGIFPVAADAATLNFSGYVGVPPPPPTDFVGYIDRAYCGLLPPGRQHADRSCAKVRAWIASNVGRPRPNWTPPPFID